MTLEERLFNKDDDSFGLFFKDVPLFSDLLQAPHLFVLADLRQLVKVLLEGLKLLVGQLAEIPHSDERFRPVSEHYSQFKEKLILDGDVAADALVLLSQLLCVDLLFGDYFVGGFNFFLFEHFQETKQHVMQLRKIKVVIVVFLLCEDLVEYFELFEYILFEGETLLIYSLLHQLLQFLLEVNLILAENADDLPPQLLHLLPKILLKLDLEILELPATVGSDDELLQMPCPFYVLL